MGNILMQWMIIVLCISTGLCLQCYKCLDKSKVCNYGKTDYLGVLNCSSPDEVCATFQYETDDSSRVYTTTIRGCQLLTKEGICDQLMKTVSSKIVKNTVKRGIFCKTCDTDLCNSYANARIMLTLIFLPTFLVHILK